MYEVGPDPMKVDSPTGRFSNPGSRAIELGGGPVGGWDGAAVGCLVGTRKQEACVELFGVNVEMRLDEE